MVYVFEICVFGGNLTVVNYCVRPLLGVASEWRRGTLSEVKCSEVQ